MSDHVRLPIVDETAPAIATDSITPVSASVTSTALALDEVLDVESFTEICRSFVALYQVGIKVFSSAGEKLVDQRCGDGAWCNYIFANSEGQRRCVATVSEVKSCGLDGKSSRAALEQTCFSGLKYFVLPIRCTGEYFGRIVFGPFLPAEAKAPGPDASTLGDGFSVEALWAHRRSLRRAPEATMRRVIEHFSDVVEAMVFASLKAAMTERLHVETTTQSYEELQSVNRALRESLERLRELDKLKSNFLAMISHELRTPLTSVIGYSEMMLEGMTGPLTEEQGKYLQTIKEKGDSLLELIGTLLDISRIESGILRVNCSEVPLDELVSGAMTSVIPQAHKKQLDLRWSASDGLSDRVRCDPDKIRQVLVNLLGNAVKFTPNGGRIEVRADAWVGALVPGDAESDDRFGPPEVACLRLQVTDTGMGIPAAELSHIFENFYQVDGSQTREHNGAGLGLAIVRRFVEAHGGIVDVESEVGVGTTFRVLLPWDGPDAVDA